MNLLRRTALAFTASALAFSLNVVQADEVTPPSSANNSMMDQTNISAGNGMYGEQEGAASTASFRRPTGIAIGASDDLYISDTGNHKIRRLSSGTVSTYAGPSSSVLRDAGGQPLGALLNGSKASALFNTPAALAYGSDKSIYVADSGNNAIRKIAPSGAVVTIAGNGKIGAKDGKSTEATFYQPQGIAVTNSGVIYVADTLNHVIRKITSDGTTSTLTAASSRVVEHHPGLVLAAGDYKDGPINQALFNEPTGLVLDPKGNLYVSDSGNQRIRYIDFATGEVTTIAGAPSAGGISVYSKNALYATGSYKDGAAHAAAFYFPKGIALDESGGLLIADSLNHVVRYLKNGRVTTIAGSQSGEVGLQNVQGRTVLFNTPQDVAIASDGTIYVADSGDNVIRKIAPTTLSVDVNDRPSGIKVMLGTEQIKFDAPPELKDGSVMVPIRQIAETLGYKTTFSPDGRTVSLVKDNRAIQLNPGSKSFTLKEASQVASTGALNAAPYVNKNRVYVPLRFVAEQLGIDVKWSPETQTVILDNNG
ncbi:NHL domain-containing protein [Paenibacillus sp. FSL K6-1230]|uniref:NHL domain-containing protein n=1 Tax=Paenibacillus sp. FSL K6-1230 TaxID=2921603 RepID=UPI0003AA1D98